MMSLQWLRENIRSFHWVLYLVVAAFIITIFMDWGAGGDVTRSGGLFRKGWAAKVEGETIPTDAFFTELRRRDDQLRRAFQDQYKSSYLVQFNVTDQCARTLVDQYLLYLEARRMGLDAGPQEVARAIMETPWLRRDGQFVGKQQYQRALRSRGLTMPGFEAEIRRSLVLTKFQRFLRDSVVISDREARAHYRRSNERVKVEYLVLKPEELAGTMDPEPEALRAFYDENPERFTAPERRRFRYLVYDRDQIRDGLVDEAEVQAFYEENKEARFRLPPGQIRASHILIELPADATPDQEAATLQEAEEALARVQSGEDFVAVARELSDDQATASRGGDLGYFGRGVKPPPFEAAAFGMAVEEVSDVVRTDLGYHIIKKTGEAGASYKSLTEVRPEILEELYDRRTQIELEKTTLTAYDALKQGTPLDAVAEEAGLPVQQTDLLAEGEAFGGLSPDAAEYQQLFRIAGQEAGEPIAVPRGRLLAVAAEVRGAAPVPFDEALEEVRAAYRTDRAAEYARTRAEAIREAAAGGQSLAAAGEGLALTPTTSASISRDDPLAPDLTDEPELIELIFAQEAEAVAGPVETAQGLVVFQVVEKKPVDWDQFPDRKEGIVETLRSRRTNDRYFSLLQHLRESRSWRVNEAFIQQVNRRYQEQDQDQSQTAAG